MHQTGFDFFYLLTKKIKCPKFDKTGNCRFSVTVANATYTWSDAIVLTRVGENTDVRVSGELRIENRRKYPRLSLKNPCKILARDERIVPGTMVSLSANGIALMSKNGSIKIGDLLRITIKNFEIIEAYVKKKCKGMSV